MRTFHHRRSRLDTTALESDLNRRNAEAVRMDDTNGKTQVAEQVGRSESGFSGAMPVRISLSGRLAQGQLVYLDELVDLAVQSQLLVLLDLNGITEVDRAAVRYLTNGEGAGFQIISCPGFIRHEIQVEARLITNEPEA
jgi:hypothetical protein